MPLARVILGPAPHLTALVYRRDLLRLELRTGTEVDVTLAEGATRIFPA